MYGLLNARSYTWATRPTGISVGQIIHVTDVGSAAGSYWMFDGTYWVPLNGVVLLDASAVAAVCPADVNENTLATIVIPAGIMGANGRLRVSETWTVNNNANAKTRRTKIGGASGSVFNSSNIASTVSQSCIAWMANANDVAVQSGTAPGSSTGLGSSSSANDTAAVDTSAATSIVITAQKAVNTDTMTLESYSVELLSK